MTRYYYTHHLAAAWMREKFFMCFRNDGPSKGFPNGGDQIILSGDDNHFYLRNDCTKPYRDKLYLCEHSVKLLEPQIGDLINNGSVMFFTGDPCILWVKGDVKIIQRNGIPFMWPHEEEA